MKYGIIGYGNMGKAICEGLKKYELYVTRSDVSKFSDEPFNICTSINQVIENSDIIILCVKPNKYKDILENYDFNNKAIVSIGAGITSKFMDKYSKNYVLTMPNVSCSNNNSITPIVRNDTHNYNEVLKLFNILGETIEITEEELPEYVALLGSSPAYFYQYVEFLNNSFNIENSEVFLAKVMLSCAQKIIENNGNSKELKESVCSEGGCTIEYVNHLNSCNLNDEIQIGVKKVIKKNREMENLYY